MSDAPADRPDPLRAWLEATGGDQTGRAVPTTESDQGAPSGRLLAGTAVVCVVAVLLAAGVRAEGVATPPPPPAPVPTSTPVVDPTAAPGDDATTADPAVSAAALLAIRRKAGSEIYVDTAAVEAVEQLPTGALVTVTALILWRMRDGWSQPQAARFAIPVGSVGGTPVALAAPWRLPVQRPTMPSPQWREVDDRALLGRAAQAIAAAGYASVSGAQAHVTDDIPGVVRVTVHAVAPGEDTRRSHELWLGSDAGRVLGMPSLPPVPVPGELP